MTSALHTDASHRESRAGHKLLLLKKRPIIYLAADLSGIGSGMWAFSISWFYKRDYKCTSESASAGAKCSTRPMLQPAASIQTNLREEEEEEDDRSRSNLTVAFFESGPQSRMSSRCALAVTRSHSNDCHHHQSTVQWVIGNRPTVMASLERGYLSLITTSVLY